MGDPVEIREFARGYFDTDRPPYLPGADVRKNERGYYLRLDFDGIGDGDLTDLVAKARSNFEVVEVVEQELVDGELAKERRYVGSIDEVPDGYVPERGPMGGIYYETQSREPSFEGSGGDRDAVSEEVGYENQPVLAVQFEDVEEGDRIAFEKPDSGERDMGEVVGIDEDGNMVTVTSGDGETDVAAAPLEGIEKSLELPTVCRQCEGSENRTRMEGSMICPECATRSESDAFADFDKDEDDYTLCTETEKDGDGGSGGGTLTSATEGAHNARHSPEDDEEDDLGIAGEVSKDGEEVWTYYWGPDGGEGWMNVQTGEVRYQQQRPGQAPEGGDGYDDWLAEGWTEPPDDLTELEEGQTVEYWEDSTEEYHEGTVEVLDPDGQYARVKGDGPNGIVGPSGMDELTAVAETDTDSESSEGSEGPDVAGYDWGSALWQSAPAEYDWEPIQSVSNETVEEGQRAILVADYDHEAKPTAYVGDLYYEDTQDEWKIDVKNHDGKDYNFETPVNDNGVEAYVDSDGGDGAEETGDAEDPVDSGDDEAPADGADAAAEAAETAEATEADAEAQQLLDEIEEETEVSEYDPDAVDDWRDMSDIGASHGNSVAAMEVAVMDDGSKWVHKDVSHHSVDETDIQREMAGYEAAKYLDSNVPAHKADLGAGWAASEVAPGVDAKDATPEMQEAVDEEDFHEMAATQLIIGNTDLHQNNLRVDEDGELYPFDLDRSAGDLQGEWVGNLTQYDDTLDRALGEMEKAASALGVQMDREQVIDHAVQQASRVMNDAVMASDVVNDAKSANEQMGEVIRQNLQALFDGKVKV